MPEPTYTISSEFAEEILHVLEMASVNLRVAEDRAEAGDAYDKLNALIGERTLSEEEGGTDA
jgi:hypothetical protein